MKLNPAQEEAVTYTDGPCLVLAGAGSGKTRVIITKIAYMLRNNLVLPSEVVAVTFTNKAAAEMRERITAEVGPELSSQLTILTFHSFGRMIINEQAQRLQLNRHFSIFDENDAIKSIKNIIIEDYPQLKKKSSSPDFLNHLASRISIWKGQLKTPRSLQREPEVDPFEREIYQKYTDYLRACNAIDYDDMIFLPTRLLLLQEDVRTYYQNRYRYVMVDEYQDTNHTQYYLFMCLVAATQRFMVVGDDDQSIYSWRGARPENIQTLATDFPNLKVIKLEQNYRSTARILRCANSIIAHNPHLFSKTLYSALGEGPKVKVVTCLDNDKSCEYIAAEILGQHFDRHDKWDNYAILYRSNAQARDMEKAMMSAHIPCSITGDTSFFARAEVKDIMAWCRMLANPHDDAALLRIINVPPRGIGAQTIKTLCELGRKYNRCLYDCIISQELQQRLTKAQLDAVSGFLGIVIDMRHKIYHHQDVEVCHNLVARLHYDSYLRSESASDNAYEWRLKNVNILLGWIEELITGKKSAFGGQGQSQQEQISFSEAVMRLGLREMMNQKEGEDMQDAVHMMTMHAAKGLEFPYVFILGMEEGTLPNRNAVEENNIEEERRLAYVGVTRAKQELTLVRAYQRKQNNVMTLMEPSRFIAEMPPEDLTIIDLSAKEQVATPAARKAGKEMALQELQAFAQTIENKQG